MSIYWFAQKSSLCIHFSRPNIIKRNFLLGVEIIYSNFFVIIVKYGINPLDIEMGNLKQVSNKQNWMVKGFIYVAQDIPKKLVHFPLIFIYLLLFSSSYPNILSAINSLIISLLMTFVIYSKISLYSVFRKSKDKNK